MHSDDDASLSPEPSHNQIHKVPCTLPYTAHMMSFTTCPCVLWCCQLRGKVEGCAVSALQQSCWVELTALLIGIVTFSKTADNTHRLDFTSRALPFKSYVWHSLGKCCCRKLDPFVIAFFSGEFNAFAHKPAAASTAAAAGTHTQPG